MKDHATIWVCTDCMLHHANGECGGCHDDAGHDCEPLQLIDCEITMGMMREEHGEGCDMAEECNCETDYFSWSQCSGCGSHLGGERHAMTIWWDES